MKNAQLVFKRCGEMRFFVWGFGGEEVFFCGDLVGEGFLWGFDEDVFLWKFDEVFCGNLVGRRFFFRVFW